MPEPHRPSERTPVRSGRPTMRPRRLSETLVMAPAQKLNGFGSGEWKDPARATGRNPAPAALAGAAAAARRR